MSTLAFLSKIIEKVVEQQLPSYLQDNKFNELLHSSYKKYHSALHHLESRFGVCVVEWLMSYMPESHQCIRTGNHLSSKTRLLCGLPLFWGLCYLPCTLRLLVTLSRNTILTFISTPTTRSSTSHVDRVQPYTCVKHVPVLLA